MQRLMLFKYDNPDTRVLEKFWYPYRTLSEYDL